MTAPAACAPIGVFDSGVGGLSILRALRRELPSERFVYLADAGQAPYGERGDAFVEARACAITTFLREAHGIKALVVACNTATAAAIGELRRRHSDLVLVGVEPALKPAALVTRTGRVGVMATRGTLASGKFADLLASQSARAEYVLQACDGLATVIERAGGADDRSAQDTIEIEALCAYYTGAMGQFGPQPGAIDTLVLGCTHYVFAESILRRLVGPRVWLIETGVPVARQTRFLLEQAGQVATRTDSMPGEFLSTGDRGRLRTAVARWLGLPGVVVQTPRIESVPTVAVTCA